MGGSGVLQLLLAPSMCQALSTVGLQPPARLDLTEITLWGDMARNQEIPLLGLWECRGSPGPSLGLGKASQTDVGCTETLRMKQASPALARETCVPQVLPCAQGEK